MAEMEEDAAPGWEAIDMALRPLYGDQKPVHWAPTTPRVLGGKDPLDGVSAYPRDSPVPHWHFVTYGFSELYAKEEKDPEVSGFGFELTFRLRREPEEAQPPAWPYNFLQNLARYVFSSGNGFEPGHKMDIHGPIRADAETEIHALVFALDPELPPVATPHGSLQFLQVTGITLDELEAARAWDADRFLAVLEERLPLRVTDLARRSILADPEVAERVRRGIAADGSSTGMLALGSLRWEIHKPFLRAPWLEVVLRAPQAESLKAVLPGRLPFDRPLTLVAFPWIVHLTPGAETAWTVRGEQVIEVALPAGAARDLAGRLEAREGTYPVDGKPLVVFRVEESAAGAGGSGA
jgi:suppressor of fused